MPTVILGLACIAPLSTNGTSAPLKASLSRFQTSSDVGQIISPNIGVANSSGSNVTAIPASFRVFAMSSAYVEDSGSFELKPNVTAKGAARRTSTILSCSCFEIRLHATSCCKCCRSSFACAASRFAALILDSVSNLNRSKAISVARVSLLCETIDPAVVTPMVVAASAATITDAISQKSHHSPVWPRNRVEAAAFTLLIVSVIGGFTILIFGVIETPF
jgi:hypothetical protein